MMHCSADQIDVKVIWKADKPSDPTHASDLVQSAYKTAVKAMEGKHGDEDVTTLVIQSDVLYSSHLGSHIQTAWQTGRLQGHGKFASGVGFLVGGREMGVTGARSDGEFYTDDEDEHREKIWPAEAAEGRSEAVRRDELDRALKKGRRWQT